MDCKYAGMTVNERPHVAGLLREFEKAIDENNKEEVIRILKEVELTDENINPILKLSLIHI